MPPTYTHSTPCGRYAQSPNEPFLRHTSTHEPVLTPPRYYASHSLYLSGSTACRSAWTSWKNSRYPSSASAIQTPWFELADQELKDICTLVNCKGYNNRSEQALKEGIRKLGVRVDKGRRAEERLRNGEAEKGDKEKVRRG